MPKIGSASEKPPIRSVENGSSAGLLSANLDFLTGGGDMSERIRRHDWSRTPLGPIESWPNSLKTAVSICLNSRFPMVIWWGRELVLLYNEGWRPILGQNKDRVALGSPGKVVWAEVWDVLGPMFEQVLDEGKATWSDDGLLLVNRYGYTEEAYFTWSYSPIRSDSGAVDGAFTAVTETTGRVIGERRLRTLRELLERTFEQAKTPEQACHAASETLAKNKYDIPFALIYLLDEAGKKARLIEAAGIQAGSPPAPSTIELECEEPTWHLNEALTTGSLQPVKNLDEKFGPLTAGAWNDDYTREAVVIPLAKAGIQDLPAGFLIAGISPRIRFDDKYRDFLQLAAGHVATAIANARALEGERKRAETLAELDRAKTTFFSNISHELRTPLTLMLGPTEDALFASRPLMGADLDLVHRNDLRLLKLVNTLLDFSRIEAGRVQASFELTDLGTFTAELASVFRSAVERAGLRLIVDCERSDDPVYIDREMWEKIVLNLLSNALKCTFEGEIRVEVHPGNDGARVMIRDTGTGISSDQLPHLFERFHRIEGARRRTHEGSGIGLALVHELVKMHGGSIHVQSQLGQGTVFEIGVPYGTEHLPQERITSRPDYHTTSASSPYVTEALSWISPDEREADQAMSHELTTLIAVENRSTTSGRVLLVDDNRDLREYVLRILRPHFSVITAADGKQAFEIALKDPPDLILSDIMMPGMNGFELLAAVRSNRSLETVPVILLSARAGEEARVEGLERGADDYLVKPFSARELVARVQTHLELARIRKNAMKSAKENERRFREIIDALPAAVYTTDAEGRLTHFNPAAVEFSGRTPQLGTDKWCVTWKLYRPDGTPLPHDECPMAVSLKLGRSIRGQEAIAERPDGSRIWFVPYPTPLHDTDGKLTGGINMLVDISERKKAEQELRQSEEELRLLQSVGTTLASELDLKALVQSVTDAGRQLSGAEFGAFFYNVIDDKGESYMLYTLSGAPPEAFAKFPMPRNTAIFGPTFAGTGTIRIDDVRKDARYGKNEPYRGMPPGHLPVRSYLAVPVVSRSGEVIGGLFYGHHETGVFTEKAERLVEGVAKQAALAFDNARLFEAVKRERTQAVANAERLRAIFRSSAIGVAVLSLNAEFLQANEAYCEITGYSEDELRAARCHDLTHPDDCARMQADLDRLIKGEISTFVMEKRYFRKDGRTIWVQNSVSLTRDEAGNAEHIIALCEEITDRKEAERLLRENERRFRQMIDALPTAVYTTDGEGRLTHFNPAAVEFAGRVPRLGVDRWCVSARLFRPDGTPLPLDECPMAVALSENRVVRGEEAIAERPDGERKWFAPFPTPLRDEQGNVVGGINMLVDITERKKDEEILRQSEERFRAIVGTTPECVKLVAADGTLLLMNAPGLKLIGATSAESVEGMCVYDLIAPEHRQRFREFNEHICGGSKGSIEFDIIGLDGTRRHMETHAAPMRTPDGSIAHLAVTRDVSERKRAEEALRRSEKIAAVGRLAATMAHEINNPLASVTNLLFLVKKDEGISQRARKQLELADQELDRVAHVARQTLGFYRDNAAPGWFKVSDSIEELVEIYRYKFRNREIELVKELDPSVEVFASTGEFRQVFSNLLVNAVDALPAERGKIRIRARQAREWSNFGRRGVRITIADSGCGIAPEHRSRIFESFFTTKQDVGTGLGLWLTRTLVEKYGGTIQLKSRAQKGKSGTAFSVFWPTGAPANKEKTA